MPDAFVREYLKNSLGRFRSSARRTDSYHVFRFFQPSLIANYNHDGLAAKYCRPRHRVIDMHGTVGHHYGSPEMEHWLDVLREYDLSLPPDDLIMVEREPSENPILRARLEARLCEAGKFSPAFVCIIGYTFARTDAGHDDWVSLDFILHRFRRFRGAVYVLDRSPGELHELLASAFAEAHVVGVACLWNVLAHAFTEEMLNRTHWPSLNDTYREILDRFGAYEIFPRLAACS
jgi:hypothetical protein